MGISNSGISGVLRKYLRNNSTFKNTIQTGLPLVNAAGFLLRAKFEWTVNIPGSYFDLNSLNNHCATKAKHNFLSHRCNAPGIHRTKQGAVRARS